MLDGNHRVSNNNVIRRDHIQICAANEVDDMDPALPNVATLQSRIARGVKAVVLHPRTPLEALTYLATGA